MPPSWIRRGVDVLDAALDLALPSVCVGCPSTCGPGLLLCPACTGQFPADLWPAARVAMPDPVPLGMPVVTAHGAFTGVLRRVVTAYKDDDRRDAVRLLAPLLAESLGSVVGSVLGSALGSPRGSRSGSSDRPGRFGGPDGEVWVVPMPCSRASRRRRGDDPVRDLTVAAARLLHRPDVSVQAVLSATRPLADQSRLDHRERALNLSGAYTVQRRSAAALVGRRVVLADDVVTTGATLAEAARAIRSAGGLVVGAATVAATQRTSRPER